MVFGPGGWMLKVIVPVPSGVALASRMACRREPTPLSAAVVTVNVAAPSVRGRRNSDAARLNVFQKFGIESQRDSATKPRVARAPLERSGGGRHELPWVK